MAESFVDINRQLEKITINQIKKTFPIETPSKIMELGNDLSLEVTKDIYSDVPAQKDTKIKRKSWTVPLKGTVTLKDKKTGEIISSKRVKILDMPVMTNRYSFIIDGNEYSSMYQWRLKPGIYTRLTKDGFYESTFNLALAKLNMRLDPESLLFYLMVDETSEKFYLYPILRAFNVPDQQIVRAWGKEITDKNRAIGLTNEASVLIGLAKKVAKLDPARTTPISLDEAKTLIQKYFEGTQLDAKVVGITVGVESPRIDADVMLATSKKLLKVMRGEEQEDERDSLAFKDIYNVADRVDYFLDRNLKPVVRKLEYKMRGKVDVGDILSGDTFAKTYKNAFLKDDLISPNPQTNPMEMLLESRKTTVMGPGGIQSRHAITEDVRNIHPSHIGILDPLQTPEGQKVGITVPLSVYTKKEGKAITTAYIDKQGNEKFLSPLDTFNYTIGFPDQYTLTNGKPVAKHEKVKGYKAGKPGLFDPSEVDVYLKGSYQLWSLGSSVVPFLNSNSGNRAAMAGRQMTQAVQLMEPEAPFVSVKDPVTGSTWNQLFGNSLNIRPTSSFTTGVVTKITPDYIYLKEDGTGRSEKIGLYNNFPLNQESFLHSKPLVKVGDKVDKKTLLARNNFQAEDNSLALGKNVNVAYIPWKGLNVEDATVVTETAANKLFVSESIQRETLVYDNKTVLNLNKFRGLFPDKIVGDDVQKFESDGIIKVGETVHHGDYLVVAAREKEFTSEQIALNKLNKRLAKPYVDISIQWESDEPGEVVYVNRGSKRIDIHVKMKSPLRVGDKLSGQWGNKMIVSKIIPDNEAPHTQDGRRADLIMHPFGVIGRTNIGQLLSTAAGKITQKTGKPYVITNFDYESNVDKVLKDLKDNGVEPNEVMTNGKDGQPFERKIFYGPQYIMKLKHMVDHKMKARSFGSYDINEQVVKGKEGGQSIDPLQWYALTAHGLKQNLAETTKYLNVKNDEFWRAIQLNLPVPKPTKNFVWDKFENYLKGTGIDLKREGNLIKMVPMTDKHLLEISGGEIKQPRFLIGKNLAEIKGGFFDPEITGGLAGTKFSHIELVERIPNPVYEGTLQKLMGLSKDAYARKLSDGTLFKDVNEFLTTLDPPAKLRELEDKITTAKKGEVAKLNYQIRVLRNLRDLGLKPIDAYTMKYVPIVPPKFRPIYPLPNGDLNASPVNYHYRDVGLMNQELKEVSELGIETKDTKLARAKLYQAVRAAQGLGDPVTYDNTKEGLIKTLAGDDPGSGFIQGKLWRKRRDLSGRSVATVNPELGIDEIGIPNEMLWTIYKPFIIKELVSTGVSPVAAAKHYKDRSPLADRALDMAIKERPIFMNRAPSLHKHSVMSFKPRRTNEISIQANPLIFTGYNLDFDGDQVMIYPPVTTEAVEEAYNALPSRNPFKSGTRSVIHGHTWDYKIGLYYATKKGNRTGLRFNSIEEARNYKPALKYNDVFYLNGQEMTLGLWDANEPLPEDMRDYNREIDAKVYSSMLEKIVEKHPKNFSDVINRWKDLGYNTAFVRGQTLSITDMKYDTSVRDKVLNKALKDINKNPKNMLDIMNKAENEIEKYQTEQLKATGNNAWDFVESKALSGAKGKNITQVLSMVGYVADLKGNPIPVPITKSWAEGQDTFSYWNTLYGARKGSVDRSLNTANTGYLNKSLLNNTARVVITEEDCETDKFIEETNILPIHLVGRVLAKDVPGVGKRDEVITSEMFDSIKRLNKMSLPIRSPLTCEAKDSGVCQMCYGWLSTNHFPMVGENIGVADSQSITEPLTQDTMKCQSKDGLALFRINGEEKFITHEEAWEEEPSEIKIEGNIESKENTINLEIFDGKTFNKVKMLQRHKPTVPVVFVKLEDGNALVTQEDHPIIVFNLQDKSENFSKVFLKDMDLSNQGMLVNYDMFMNKTGNTYDPEISGFSCGKGMKLSGKFYEYSIEWLTNFMLGLVDSTDSYNFTEYGTFKVNSTDWAFMQKIFIICKILDMHCSIEYDQTNKVYIADIDTDKFVRKDSKFVASVKDYEPIEYKDYTYDFPIEDTKYLVNGILYSNTFHCFHPGMTVYTEDRKLMTIKELVDQNYRGKILDINGKFVNVVGGWKHEVTDKILFAKTEAGHSIISQGNHPVQVGNEESYETKELKDVHTSEESFIESSFPTNFGSVEWNYLVDPYIVGSTIAKYEDNLKTLPVNILNYDKNSILKIIAGIIDNNGYIDNAVVIGTDSYSFANQLAIVIRSLGYLVDIDRGNRQQFVVSIYLDGAQKSELSKYSVICSSLGEVNTKDNLNSSVVKKIEDIYYPYSEVYDLKTESGTFAANGLWVHNSGGKVGVVNAADGFERANELLRLSQNPQGIGTLSLQKGRITNISPNPAGGYNVYVNEKSHYVPFGRELKVKKGDLVTAGDPLSDGVYRPQDIAEFKGIEPAREYMVNELQKTFTNPNGIMRRSVETVVKGITDRVEITDSKDDPDFVRGDIAAENHIKRINRDRQKEGLEPIEYKPYLKNIDILPIKGTDDWGEMVGARNIKKVITESAALGRNMNIHGTHPLPGYMYALEFGQQPYY